MASHWRRRAFAARAHDVRRRCGGDGDAEELARVLDAGRDPLLVLARGELQEHGFEIGGDDVVRDAADGDADGDAFGELDLQAVV